MTDYTHILVLKNCDFLRSRGTLVASVAISKINNYNEDCRWLNKTIHEIETRGEATVYCGSETDCIEQSKILTDTDIKFSILEI